MREYTSGILSVLLQLLEDASEFSEAPNRLSREHASMRGKFVVAAEQRDVCERNKRCGSLRANPGHREQRFVGPVVRERIGYECAGPDVAYHRRWRCTTLASA